MSTNQTIMRLTDIDLSSLAEVAAAAALLEHVHRELATGGVPLPSLPPAEFVVNPAPSSEAAKIMACAVPDDTALRQIGVAMTLPGLPAALAADAEKLRGLGIDPVTAQPTDAATVFGGAPAQSAAPLPALSTAGAAASPTAPAPLPASGLAPLASPAPAPLPVASADAPAAPVPQASPAGGVELDADRLPWDERIHAGTKRKNADGRWTAKRGINDPDLVPRVVAQLRAQMAAGGVRMFAQPPADLLPPVQAQSAAPLPQSTPAQSTAPLAALPATSGLASLAAPTPHAHLAGKPTPTTFADFMAAATVEVQSGRLTALQFGEACKLYGGPAGLATNPAAIPTVWAALKAQYPGIL